MIPMYNTVKFTDVFGDVSEFKSEYHDCGIPQMLNDNDISTLFYLLYAKYGNDPISNNDINQFKYRVFATVFQYGPTWTKRLEIQERLRTMSEDDMRTGYKQISNRANNPDTDPGTGDLDELTYVNSQDVTKAKKSIIGAYGELWQLLKLDVTEEFLNKFRKLFKQVVIPEHTYIYVTEETE